MKLFFFKHIKDFGDEWYVQILNLKAKLSRYENPDYPDYTEQEMDAMTAENEVK